MLSSLVHLWLRGQLDYQQSVGQLGSGVETGVRNAFNVLETRIGKALEWQPRIWFAIVDLRQNLDKLPHEQ